MSNNEYAKSNNEAWKRQLSINDNTIKELTNLERQIDRLMSTIELCVQKIIQTNNRVNELEKEVSELKSNR